MELNAGHYKYYKCRSLLACDAGGTVYDTSRVCSNSSCSDTGTFQRDQLEKIIYIANRKKNNEKRRLVDSTTHLDDDEFNDYEMHSSASCEPERQAVLSVSGKEEIENFDPDQSCQNKDLHYYLLKNDDDSDTVSITQKSELSQDSNNLSDASYLDIVNDSKQYTSPKENIDNFRYPFVVSQIKYELDGSKELNSIKQEVSEYDFDPLSRSEIELKNNNCKSKQKYTVKDDSFIKIKLKYQKRNPFANVKMSSILKGNKKLSPKNHKNYYKQLRRKSLMTLYKENVAIDNHNLNNEELKYKTSYCMDQCSPDSRKDEATEATVLQTGVNAIINLNSDLTTADYFDYVQPREKVIESDMDKLLSPTIDVDFSEIFKVCHRTRVLQEKRKLNNKIIEKCKPIDFNGNEVDFQDIRKINNSKLLSPTKVAERELFLKSIYAKKLGYKNYFNTSNDSVINDILYDKGLDYRDIEMDTNFIIMNIEVYSKQNQLDKSCTLLESLYEFNRFGGFVDENYNEDKSFCTEENLNETVVKDSLYNFSEDKFHAEPYSTSANDIEGREENSQSDLTFNFSNKSKLLGIDYQSKYNSAECLDKKEIGSKQTAPLKIKIKRVNDENNEYVIDDSSVKIKKKKKSKPMNNVVKSTKDIDRYECHDCSMKFRTKKILQSHVSEYHKGPYDLECEICHMKFRKSSARKKHEPWCEKDVKHKCDICEKVYCYQGSLLKHRKTHASAPQ